MVTSAAPLLRSIRPRAVLAALASLSLVATALLSPPLPAAADLLEQLRRPGEAGVVVAHRGGEHLAENTLPALAAALQGPAAFVETDVQLSRDGVPVLMHDWTVDRTTDGSGPVWAHSYEQLRRLDAGSWAGPEHRDIPVPSLAQFLELLAPTGKFALIELKGSWNRDQLALVARLLQRAAVERRVILASFTVSTLQGLRDVAPQVSRAIIVREVVGDPAALAAAAGALAIVTSGAFLDRDPNAVERIHQDGVAVLAYTLNTPESWARALAVGVDGLVSDRPTALHDWLGDRP